MSHQPRYDAIVIGGGPAGLIAATYLARFRRSTLLVHAGPGRAAAIPRSHNYPGFPDGVTGVELVASLRAQALRYAVDEVAGRVERIEPLHQGGQEFRVHWATGRAVGRTVLLATGASDVAPDMPYVADALREGALRYCPVCDGYEVIDQHVGVLTDGPAGAREALYLRHYTPHITVFKSGSGVRLDDAVRSQLAGAGIVVAEAPVDSIRLWNGRATVRHGGLETTCDTVYGALGLRVHSDLATALGAEADEDGYLQVDRHGRTTVPGLYAAGDVAQGLNQISVAAGGAATATSAMHLALGAMDRAGSSEARQGAMRKTA
jgi:thioredoxin reductase (NADPH)